MDNMRVRVGDIIKLKDSDSVNVFWHHAIGEIIDTDEHRETVTIRFADPPGNSPAMLTFDHTFIGNFCDVIDEGGVEENYGVEDDI